MNRKLDRRVGTNPETGHMFNEYIAEIGSDGWVAPKTVVYRFEVGKGTTLSINDRVIATAPMFNAAAELDLEYTWQAHTGIATGDFMDKLHQQEAA